MQLNDLSLILITHLHSDHNLELDPLIHAAWTADLKTPVDLYVPAGLDAYWDAFFVIDDSGHRSADRDESRPDLRDLVQFLVIDTGQVLARDRITVSAIRTEHPHLMDCFALSFNTDAVHFVLSSDTVPIAALEDFARRADLLIHEAMPWSCFCT